MLKLKIKTNRDRISALVIIIRFITAQDISKYKVQNNVRYSMLLMQHECCNYAIKLIQIPNPKSLTIPPFISIALNLFYDDVCPVLDIYEQTFYRELISDMDKLYHNMNIQKNMLYLQ